MDVKNITVTKFELAEFFGVNASSVTKWIKAGMPVASPKALNLAECVKWHLDQQKGEKAKTQQDAKTKLIEAQTRRIKLQILEKRGDLVQLEQVKFQIQKTIETVKQRINNLVTKLPAKLENKTQVQIGVILKEDIKKALDNIDV